MKVEIKSIAGTTLYTAEIGDGIPSGPQVRAALEKATTDCADLGGADLHSANLHGANLGDADLRNADLGGADLGGADLGGAYLHGADLGGAYLHGADLGGANLHGAKLGDKLVLVGQRPIISIGPIGSRFDIFFGLVTDQGLRVRTGCFFGTPDEIKVILEITHGGNAFAREYLLALELLQLHSELYSAPV